MGKNNKFWKIYLYLIVVLSFFALLFFGLFIFTASDIFGRGYTYIRYISIPIFYISIYFIYYFLKKKPHLKRRVILPILYVSLAIIYEFVLGAEVLSGTGIENLDMTGSPFRIIYTFLSDFLLLIYSLHLVIKR
jgi:hypothetical protein